MINDVVNNHPTANKQRLLSKIFAQMMIKCNGSINSAQIEELQDYKYYPDSFNYKKVGFRELIEIDWELIYYRPKSNPPAADEG